MIAVPKSDEQMKIVAALSDIDALITNQEKLIAKKKAIKQGAMQELLTGKRRLKGFRGDWHDIAIGVSQMYMLVGHLAQLILLIGAETSRG